ncbi:MAG: hypothetical protein KAZ45_00560 [Arenimonas sp.]|nr:hypothetical protein [Arenimonas sp.]MBP7916934.1 hypothetical protein [Arenimonas sp.]
MRALIYILIGLLSGALLTSMLINTISKGSEFPKGVMAIQKHHFGELNRLAKDNRCSNNEIQQNLLRMRLMADDIEPAFKSLSEEDIQFVRNSADLRRVLDLQLAKSIDNCADLATATSAIEQACDNCHRDYK